MSFKYKITDVTTAHITVDFENGNWAKVPIIKGETKEEIEERIRQYATQTSKVFDSVSAVPFAVNDEATILNSVEQREAESELGAIRVGNTVVQYKDMRWAQYPGPLLQLEALYKARKGDNTLLNKVDAIIDEVKARFPKDTPNTTQKEYKEAWDEGSVDDRDGKKKRIMTHQENHVYL